MHAYVLNDCEWRDCARSERIFIHCGGRIGLRLWFSGIVRFCLRFVIARILRLCFVISRILRLCFRGFVSCLSCTNQCVDIGIYRGSLCIVFTLDNLFRIALYFATGILNLEIAAWALQLLPMMLDLRSSFSDLMDMKRMMMWGMPK